MESQTEGVPEPEETEGTTPGSEPEPEFGEHTPDSSDLIPSHADEIESIEGDEDPPEVEINPTDGEHDDFGADDEMRPPEDLPEESQRADITDGRSHSDEEDGV